MGIANTIMAVAEGVEVIHSTVLGLGERAGNVPMEETAMALLTMYGVDTGLKYDKLYGLARLVEKLSGHKVASNRPVVGEQLFHIESGIIASWWQNCGTGQSDRAVPVSLGCGWPAGPRRSCSARAAASIPSRRR